MMPTFRRSILAILMMFSSFCVATEPLKDKQQLLVVGISADLLPSEAKQVPDNTTIVEEVAVLNNSVTDNGNGTNEVVHVLDNHDIVEGADASNNSVTDTGNGTNGEIVSTMPPMLGSDQPPNNTVVQQCSCANGIVHYALFFLLGVIVALVFIALYILFRGQEERRPDGAVRVDVVAV